MKRTYLKRIYLIVAIVSFSLLTAGFINYKKPVYMNIFQLDPVGLGTIVPQATFVTWTNIDEALQPQNVFVLPADGPNFEGDNNDAANNFDFHRWASQMFLWILSPTPSDGSYGNCSGLVLNSQEFYNYDEANEKYVKHNCNSAINAVTDILKGGKNTMNVGSSMTFSVKGTNNGGKNLPLLIEKETNQIFDVDKTPADDKGNPLIYDENRNRVAVGNIKITDNKPVFYDLNGKEIIKPSLIFSEGLDERTTVQQFAFDKTIIDISSNSGTPIIILPAQGQQDQLANGNVLMARNGSLVYYNIMVNDIYAVFSTMLVKGVANGGLPDTAKFPTTQNELDVIKAYAAAHNIPLVDTNNRVLAMELKTSWVETIQFTGVNYDNYVTIQTTIPNYSQNQITHIWTLDANQPSRIATLALVGMHVVGSVQGHPEMIWSTFEHANNTPNVAFQCSVNSGFSQVQSDLNSNNWLFCNNNATNFNIPFIIKDGNTLKPSASAPGQMIAASNTRRNKPFGWAGPVQLAGTNAMKLEEIPFEEDSNARLVALNIDVQNRLHPNDVRRMYYQVGATWNSKTGAFANATSDHVGTIALSNSTMETYTQGAASNNNNGLNCFSCHASIKGNSNRDMPKNTALSHVFYKYLIP